MASNSQLLKSHYPWTITPLITSAPMRLISTKPLALSVSRAGGLGFLGIGTDASILFELLKSATSTLSESPIPNTPPDLLPFGIGLIIWGASLPQTLQTLKETLLKPVAIWLFAPHKTTDFKTWTSELRKVCGTQTKIWIQVGTVSMAVEVARDCSPDVLVIQGFDAGGHGLAHSSSIMSLLPECKDILSKEGFGNIQLIAAGGIVDGRGVAAALTLGADGICMGTRFLGSEEAEISQGYKKAVTDSGDGGVATKRTNIYDQLRGITGWPKEYNARGVLNRSFWDSEDGIQEEENKRLYEEALGKGDDGWGLEGRLTTYAGTGVGLVKEVMPAAEIVKEVVSSAKGCLERARPKL